MRNYGSKRQIGAGVTATVVLLLAILPLSIQVQSVTVTGNDRCSIKQMEELLFTGRWGKNSVHAYFSDKLRPHIQVPFVESYKVVFHNLLDAEMIIHKKSIVGYVSYMSSLMYLDRDGIVMESSGSRLPGAPWITSMRFGRIVLHRPLPVDDGNIFEEILNLTQQLSAYDIAVDRVQHDSHGQATLFIRMMEVTIGDHMDIDRKISTLNDILKAQPQLTEIGRAMKLDNYSESNNGAGITFKKK